MENSININITPIQMLISVLLQVWLIVFPIIIIKKLNYLVELLEGRNEANDETP